MKKADDEIMKAMLEKVVSSEEVSVAIDKIEFTKKHFKQFSDNILNELNPD